MFFRPALLFLQIKRRILDGNETATPDGRFDEPVTLQFLIGTLYGDYTDVQGLRQGLRIDGIGSPARSVPSMICALICSVIWV